MNLIIAIIKPFKLEEVRYKLLATGIFGMTVSEISGFGRQQGDDDFPDQVAQQIKQIPKAKIEVAVESYRTNEIVRIIQDSAHTNHSEDGIIFVKKLNSVIRVRTGEKGQLALK